MNGTLTAPQRPPGDVTRRGFFGRLLGGIATVVLGRKLRYDFLRAETRLPGGAVVTDEALCADGPTCTRCRRVPFPPIMGIEARTGRLVTFDTYGRAVVVAGPAKVACR